MAARRIKKRRALISLAAALAAWPSVSSAATYTWNGGDPTFGFMSLGDNWVSGSSPYTAVSGTADLLFASTNPHGFNPTMNGALAVNSLTFNSSALAYTLVTNGSGFSGILTIGTGGLIDNAINAESITGATAVATNSALQTWNIASGAFTDSTPLTLNNDLKVNTIAATASATFSGAPSGNHTLTKMGAGTLTLSGGGNIDFLEMNGGTTNVATGTLTIQVLHVDGGALTLSGGATLDASGDSGYNLIGGAAGTSMTLTGGSKYIEGNEFFVGIGGSGTLNVSNSSQFSSKFLYVPFGSDGVLSVTSGGVVKSGSLFIGGSTTTSMVNVSGAGAVIITAVSSFRDNTTPANISGGTFTTGALSSNSAGNGIIKLADPTGGTALTINDPTAADINTYSGTISGAGSFQKSGASTQVLSGNNTFTGKLNVTGGTLNMSNSAASTYQVSTGTLVINSGNVTGPAFVNSGGLLSGTAQYSSVTLNVGGTFVPGSYSGSPSPISGSTAAIQPAASGVTAISTNILLKANTTITVNNTDVLFFNGSFTATGENITKEGTGSAYMQNFSSPVLFVDIGTLGFETSLSPFQLGALIITPGAALDVQHNHVDITGTALSTINNLVKLGCNNGLWNGGGIESLTANANTKHLTAIGVIQNNQGGSATFNSGNKFQGTIPGTGDVLLAYTYYGDANLDGKVDGSDYSRIDNGYLSHGTLTGWFNGDFNYDGLVDGSDYTLIDNAFNTQGAQLTASIASPHAINAAEIAGTSAVPEPSLSLLALGAGTLLGRRRCRK